MRAEADGDLAVCAAPSGCLAYVLLRGRSRDGHATVMRRRCDGRAARLAAQCNSTPRRIDQGLAARAVLAERLRVPPWFVAGAAARVDPCCRSLCADFAGPANQANFTFLLRGAVRGHGMPALPPGTTSGYYIRALHVPRHVKAQRSPCTLRAAKKRAAGKAGLHARPRCAAINADDSRTRHRRVFARRGSRRPTPVLR